MLRFAASPVSALALGLAAAVPAVAQDDPWETFVDGFEIVITPLPSDYGSGGYEIRVMEEERAVSSQRLDSGLPQDVAADDVDGDGREDLVVRTDRAGANGPATVEAFAFHDGAPRLVARVNGALAEGPPGDAARDQLLREFAPEAGLSAITWLNATAGDMEAEDFETAAFGASNSERIARGALLLAEFRRARAHAELMGFAGEGYEEADAALDLAWEAWTAFIDAAQIVD